MPEMFDNLESPVGGGLV